MGMDLNLTVELGLLLDTYGTLLTDKMREVLTMYVCENMSYQEIADYFQISKPAVLDAIINAQNKLLDLESKVKMLEFRSKVASACEGKNVKQELQKLLKEY